MNTCAALQGSRDPDTPQTCSILQYAHMAGLGGALPHRLWRGDVQCHAGGAPEDPGVESGISVSQGRRHLCGLFVCDRHRLALGFTCFPKSQRGASNHAKVLTFFTAYFDEREDGQDWGTTVLLQSCSAPVAPAGLDAWCQVLVTNRLRIAKRYLRDFFVIDAAELHVFPAVRVGCLASSGNSATKNLVWKPALSPPGDSQLRWPLFSPQSLFCWPFSASLTCFEGLTIWNLGLSPLASCWTMLQAVKAPLPFSRPDIATQARAVKLLRPSGFHTTSLCFPRNTPAPFGWHPWLGLCGS